MDKFRVLVVDDNLDMQWLLTVTLERAGIDTSLACDGIEALEVLDAGPTPDAIVTDIDMPRMNGLRLIESLHADERYSGIPVVVTSAIPRAVPASVFAAVTKPFDGATFTATVGDACLKGCMWKMATGRLSISPG